jgi:hypothetical protein
MLGAELHHREGPIMADPMDDEQNLREQVTRLIHAWLVLYLAPTAAGRGDGASSADFVYREVRDAVLDPEDDAEAAEGLRVYLHERLCVNPGTPGPFGPLAADLLGVLLDLADWLALAIWYRYGDEDEDGV